ncbi:hypothetical protein LO762_04975 [Actinocorallia sp. API 0066]|uniref:hypothetical protein n=1 Tax=Actinocorallia sp. API 0066 TaxID=2896846 RepID=UPI001E3478C6|nr:hypothetical protein [Actinocorallia sp. API 0066]MCD0448550.1 hypothetical protein [Actinocorallia sp. API 0066]
MIPSERTSESAADTLAGEVRLVVRNGLPVRPDQVGPRLLSLAAVRARALDAGDRGSRARALEAVLRAELDRLDNAELAAAARLLFGVVEATSGAKLTARRQAAATAAGYEVHHFRKRIEPKICGLVAGQLLRAGEDAEAALPAAPVLHAAARPLVLPADVFAWEAAEHQSAVAALWGAAYLLRAELVNVARLVSMDAPPGEVDGAADVALWRHAQVLAATAAYRACYGAVLLHAAGDLSPDQIGSSAGWTPALTPAQELLLGGLGGPDDGFASFTARLAASGGGRDLAARWRQALTGRRSRPDQEEHDG